MKFRRNTEGGFTLLELLTDISILAVMVVMLFAAFSQASRAWLVAENRVETFTQARSALDLLTRELSQAITTSNISFLGSTTNVAFVAPISTSAADLVDLEEVVYQWTGTNLVRHATSFSAGAAWDFYFNPQTWPTTASAPFPVADNVVSLDLRYVYPNGAHERFWNSTALAGFAWSGIPPSSAAGAFVGATGAMTNRAPAGVEITLGTIDTHAMTRLHAIAPFGTNGFPATVNGYTNALKQSTRYFTTFVPIPNGQL